MNRTLFSKINKPLMVLSLVTILSIGATKAYFTSFSESPENVFVSGNLEVLVNQDSILSVSDWKPGDEHMLEFTVKNLGSLPVYVKSYLGGEWNEMQLDPSVVEIISLERKVNEVWVDVTQEGVAVGEEFYLSSDGTQNSLLELSSGDLTNYRMLTRLDPATPDEYQNQTFSAALHVAARQVEEGASWPSEY